MYPLIKYTECMYSTDFLLLALLLIITGFLYAHGRRRRRRHLKLPPGPKGWPLLGALPLLGEKPNQSLAAMAKQYGPLMHLRLGNTDVVVASTPAMAQALLKTLDADISRRAYTAAARFTYDAHDMSFSPYGPRWRLMRKLTHLHLLGAKALEQWVTVRQEEVGILVRAIRDAATVPVQEMLSSTLVNIFSRMILSRRVIGAEAEGPASGFVDIIRESIILLGQFNIGDFISSIAWMNLQGVEGGLTRAHRKLDQVMDKMFEEHENTAGDRVGKPDFLDILTSEGGDSGHPGALDPRFIPLCRRWTVQLHRMGLAELLLNPAILGRAREEMDRVIGHLQGSLPFATRDCQVDGYDIPRGTRLLVNIWAIGRDREAWHKFMPERFLGDGKGAEMGPWGSDFELIPFGAGRRICVGMRITVLIVEYILGTLMHAFEWKLPEDEDGTGTGGGQTMNMEERLGMSIKKAVPLKAVARPRLSPSAYTF